MYGKVFRQMYKGSMSMAGWEAIVTMQQLIVLADRHGEVDMTPQAISGETTIPLEIIQKGLALLEQPDPESRSPDEEGRRIVRLNPSRSWGWRVVNYQHYRELRDEEARRDYQRQYWHKRKDKNSTALNKTQPNSTHAEAEVEADADKKLASARREARKARAQPMPADFTLTPERQAYAEKQLPNVDAKALFDSFLDHHRAKGTMFCDWNAAWQNWVRRAFTYGYPQRKGLNGKPARAEPTPEAMDEARRRAAEDNRRQLERVGLAALKAV